MGRVALVQSLLGVEPQQLLEKVSAYLAAVAELAAVEDAVVVGVTVVVAAAAADDDDDD